jgi:hypothetical protein
MLTALFGFMDFLIIVKWLTDFTLVESAERPPSIITSMITMVLGFGEESDPKLKERDLISN